MATKTKMTVEEYRLLPEPWDGRRTELIDGELVVVSPGGRYHGRHQALLLGALHMWERARPGRPQPWGPTDVPLGEHDLFQPDVLMAAARPRFDAHGDFERLPLICIEIRSPSTWRYDIGHKKTTYEAKGVPELWLVDGFASVLLVFRRSTPDAPSFDVSLELTSEDMLTSPLLPGFALPLSELFESSRPA